MRPEPGPLVLVGVVISLACGGLISLLSSLGLVGATIWVQLLLALILFKLYPEASTVRWSGRLLLLLCGAGVAMAGVWVTLFAWGNTRFVDVGEVGITALAVGAASAVIAAPIYEEKVVRHVLLMGAAGFVGRIPASVLVSIPFALVHAGSVIPAFFFSLALCWAALVLKLSSGQRAVAHGTYNLMNMLWYFTSGYGLFP